MDLKTARHITSASLLMLLSAAHPVCLASEKNSCPAFSFKTATGLPFRYKLKVGKNGEYNRELLIDRREKSKSLAWSSVVLAFENSKRISEEVKKPKALGDIRGVSYIYPILWRLA